MLYLLQNFLLSECSIVMLSPLSFKITLLKSNTIFGKRNGKNNSRVLSVKFNSLLLLLVSVFGRTFKTFLCMIHILLPKTRVTGYRLISLDTLKKFYISNVFRDIICDGCDHSMTCFSLFKVTSIHNI